jgi:hypothetical protein
MINNNVIIYILIVVNIVLFGLGYAIGRLMSPTGVSYIGNKVAKNNSKIEQHSAVEINESKFVTEIKTDSLEKKFDSLGETKQTQENISSAITKLKNMKG